ncbi:hypothetical protein EDB84DRAFT_1447351 [Lactarius hengduanensis]|nr:hypothetical protein EDB84DRAFT_1447351 [Lactarius hengduanensis]
MPSPAPQGGGLRPRNLGKNLFKAVLRDKGAGRVNNTIPHKDPGITYHSVQQGAGVAEVVMRRWWVGTQALVLPRLGCSFCSRASTPASHTHTPNTELQTAKMFLHIAHSLLKLAWNWIKRGVVIPLNNQMRKKGWCMEFTFTMRLNIATQSGDIFDQSLPLQLTLPWGVVVAPGEGTECHGLAAYSFFFYLSYLVLDRHLI